VGRRAADKLGWVWVALALPAWIWLGQGGAPCPPEGPPPGAACVMVLIGRDATLLFVVGLAVLGLLLDGTRGSRWLSGLVLASAGTAAGYWGATKQFLGSAWHAPRVPIVVLLMAPLLLVAAERLGRGLLPRTPATPDQREAPQPTG
jgi:hypothetical protein